MLGAPYAYVPTEKLLLEFGFESLRDLPASGAGSPRRP
jgi:chromosome segregation and condensation protein ScpB